MVGLLTMNTVTLLDFYWKWPWMLLLLLVIPVFWLMYVRFQRDRWLAAWQYSPAMVVARLKQHPSRWKRLLFPTTLSLVMALLVMALARPVLVAEFPTRSVNMMLVLDISLSMLATDIAPDRITAAREAAVRFVDSLPPDVRVGLELFAGDNYVVQSPTASHYLVTGYLKTLDERHLQTRTEIGSAIRTAIEALSRFGSPPGAEADKQVPAKPPVKGDRKKQPQQVIVLLSDGDSREGYPWHLAAADARDHNILIYTVGMGGTKPTFIEYQGQMLPVSFSENTLKNIANIAGGEYFRVFTEKDFQTVYDQVRRKALVLERQALEVGYLCAGLALLVLLLGLCGAAIWVRRLSF
ncbi:MAG: VWA domain-containing protein [Candidatus Melainabacteria bacterium]